MERLKSKIEYNKLSINLCDYLNFITKSCKYDKKIEEYQNKLTDVYERIQELKRDVKING